MAESICVSDAKAVLYGQHTVAADISERPVVGLPASFSDGETSGQTQTGSTRLLLEGLEAYRNNIIAAKMHKNIELTIGHSLRAEASANNVPTTAPRLKRNVPASDEAVPAICGKSSKITAIAFDVIIAIHPT